MSSFESSNADLEANGGGGNASLRRHRRNRRRRRRRRPSMAASSETTVDGSFRFSDSDSDQSWQSNLGSTAGGSHEECRSSTGTDGFSFRREPPRNSQRGSCSVSECLSDEEIDLESGELELKVHKEERDCRICHLSLLKSGGIGSEGGQVQECTGGLAIELGCSCKGDLGDAHKQCAETWFKIKGNTICEICGVTALNVAGEQTNEATNATTAAIAAPTAPAVLSETRSFWHGRRIMNFLLACMVFAFVISWLFHFNILP